MDIAAWLGLGLGGWGAGLSTYLGLQESRRHKPALRISVGSWTDSTPLEKDDVTAGISVSVANVGVRPLTVTEVWLELSTGGAYGASGLLTNKSRDDSDSLPKRLEDGDGALFYCLFQPWMEDVVGIKVVTASRRTFRTSEPLKEGNNWVLMTALLKLDLAAKFFGMKPDVKGADDPVQTLADAGIQPGDAVHLRIFLEELRALMKDNSPDMAVAKVAMNYEKRDQIMAALIERESS